MQIVIGVRFKKAGKIYFYDPTDYEIKKGDFIIVDTIRGLECGEVVIGPRELPNAENPEGCGFNFPIRRIHRKATKADLARVEENHRAEKKAFEICLEKIAEHDLPMKLINVDYTFDVNKIIFYFTADGRVDFRALVKDLAYIFRTRIELRQVGVRDEAKQLGGIGCCGRPLCCATFLGDFAPVSVRMAKEQNLSLNPTKISGICGRLLCCLKFESDYYHEHYVENLQNFQPHKGERVILDEGTGKVMSVSFQNKTATVSMDTDRRLVTVSWEDLLPLDYDENPGRETKKFEVTEEIEEINEVEEKIFVEEKNQPDEKPPQKNFTRQHSDYRNRHENNFNERPPRNNNFNRNRRTYRPRDYKK